MSFKFTLILTNSQIINDALVDINTPKALKKLNHIISFDLHIRIGKSN